MRALALKQGSAMRIATWNINSVRLRIGLVERFLESHSPDVLCLQEIKCREAEFPSAAFRKLGYHHIALNAQKGYHGVATISRLPLSAIHARSFCEKDDARHVSTQVMAPSGSPFTIHNYYVPAGGDVADREVNPKFAHKLDFLDEMASWSKADRIADGDSILVGDLNVAPLQNDVWSHKALLSVVSHTPAEVERLQAILGAGPWLDAIRHFRPEPERLFTWWSYRSPNWQVADKGRRLDHVWLSRSLQPLLAKMEIVKDARSWERPSDHVPVIVDLTQTS